MAYANALRRCDTCWGYETSECPRGRHERRCPKCLPLCCPRDVDTKEGDARGHHLVVAQP
jgi:hypothetical protein